MRTRAEAQARADALRPVFTELAGLSANAIAVELNTRAVPTPNGGRWHALTVIRVQKRLKEIVSPSASLQRAAQAWVGRLGDRRQAAAIRQAGRDG